GRTGAPAGPVRLRRRPGLSVGQAEQCGDDDGLSARGLSRRRDAAQRLSEAAQPALSMQIGVWPRLTKPSSCAAAFDRSITLPLMHGPRPLIGTVTVLPLRWLVTFAREPKGRVRWAAVIAAGFMRSPEAVLEVSAYQEALPHWAKAGPAQSARKAAPAKAAGRIVTMDFMSGTVPFRWRYQRLGTEWGT